MISINFIYDSSGLVKFLTESQDVSRNRLLNAAFELSWIMLLYKYLFSGDFKLLT